MQPMSLTNPNIDWPSEKENYVSWRRKLNVESNKIILEAASNKIPLDKFNDVGVYYWDSKAGKQEDVIKNYACKLFHKENSYSFGQDSMKIKRFYFKEGYSVFDPNAPACMKLWDKWVKDKNKSNPKYEVGAIFSKGEEFVYPTTLQHFDFWKEHKIGAVGVEVDYTYLCIVDPEAVSRFETITVSDKL